MRVEVDSRVGERRRDLGPEPLRHEPEQGRVVLDQVEPLQRVAEDRGHAAVGERAHRQHAARIRVEQHQQVGPWTGQVGLGVAGEEAAVGEQRCRSAASELEPLLAGLAPVGEWRIVPAPAPAGALEPGPGREREGDRQHREGNGSGRPAAPSGLGNCRRERKQQRGGGAERRQREAEHQAAGERSSTFEGIGGAGAPFTSACAGEEGKAEPAGGRRRKYCGDPQPRGRRREQGLAGFDARQEGRGTEQDGPAEGGDEHERGCGLAEPCPAASGPDPRPRGHSGEPHREHRAPGELRARHRGHRLAQQHRLGDRGRETECNERRPGGPHTAL